MKNLYPLIGICTETKKSFIISTIDFENKTVLNRTSQNGSGNHYDFEDIYIMESKYSSSIVDLLMNSAVNYDNFDLINGKETIYDNEYHEFVDEKRKEEIRLVQERKRKIEIHNNHINQKIQSLRSQLK